MKWLKVLTKLQEIFLLDFLFHFSLIQEPHTPKSSNDFIIFIISLISSFEMDKVNPFHVLTAPFPINFLSNLFIALEVKLLTNPGKLPLAKGIATFVRAFS